MGELEGGAGGRGPDEAADELHAGVRDAARGGRRGRGEKGGRRQGERRGKESKPPVEEEDDKTFDAAYKEVAAKVAALTA